MQRLSRPCAHPGCPGLAVDGSSRCAAHARREQRQYDAQRGSSSERGYGRTWQRVRLMKLGEDPLCADCLAAGSTTAAAEVHHIDGDARHNGPDNLLSLCTACHSRRTVREQGRWTGRKGATVADVTLVCGPPGSGKTRYVQERLHWGDLIVDVDYLFTAFTGQPLYDKPQLLLPFILAARDAVIERLARGEPLAQRAYVITGGARRQERQDLAKRLGAEVVMLAVPAGECVRRIQADPRRAGRAKEWVPLIEKWWAEYEA